MKDNRIKCKYCDKEFLRFKGKKQGVHTLLDHVITSHLGEYTKALNVDSLQEFLDRVEMLEEEDAYGS